MGYRKKVQYIFTLKGHTSIIWDIRELEGNKLISASDNNKSKVWDLKEKKKLLSISKYFSSYFAKIWEDDRIILYFLFLVLNKYLKFKLLKNFYIIYIAVIDI